MTPDTSAQDAPVASQEADEAVREREAEKVWRDAYPDGGAEEAWRHGLREWSLNLAEYTRSVWEYGHQTGIAAERANVAVKIGGHYADIRATTDAFETAVRADEAAGLVDILARLVEGTLSNDDIECWWCGGYGRYSLTKDDEFEFAYLDHTPDCPWVEGMIAVAERQG